MADELKLSITLDTKNVEQGFKKIENSADQAGKSIKNNLDDSTESLSSRLTEIGKGFAGVAAVAATAGFAIKKALDFALLGESTKAVEAQFDRLGKTAGIATESLKKGIIEATDGLLDGEDALKIATRGIISFGKEAERLPQILNASRIAGRSLGIDLQTSFENVSRFIQTGSERALINFGITLDLNQAYKDFAKSIDVAVESLTEQEKQTVRINEFLRISAERFGSAEKSVTPLADALTRLRVSFGDLIENTAVKFDTEFSPSLVTAINTIREFIETEGAVRRFFTFLAFPLDGLGRNISNGFSNLISAGINTTTQKLTELQGLRTKQQEGFKALQAGDTAAIAKGNSSLLLINNQILEQKTKLVDLQTALQVKLPGSSILSPVASPDDARAIQRQTRQRFEQETKISSEVERIKKESALRIAQSSEKVSRDQFFRDRSFIISEEEKKAFVLDKIVFDSEQRKKDIQVQFSLSSISNSILLAQQLKVIKAQEELDIFNLEKQFTDLKLRNTQAFLDTKKQIESNANTLRAKADEEAKFREDALASDRNAQLDDFKKKLIEVEQQAKRSIGFAFANAIGQAVNALAAGEDGVDAFLKSALGGIADLAIQYGSLFILQGAGFELIPGLQASGAGLIGAGLGLLALGAALKILTPKSETEPTTATGGGGIVAAPGPGTELVPPDELERLAEQTQVQVVVEGSIFDSDGTSTRIIELINEAFDKKGVVIQRGAFA